MTTAPATVLFIERGGEVGGAERVLLDIVSGLDPARYRPVVVCLDEGSLPARLRASGVTTVVFPVHRLRQVHRVVRALAGLVRLVRSERIDVLYANGTMMLFYGGPVAWATRRPLVWHVYDPQRTTGLVRRLFVAALVPFRPAWTIFGTLGVEANHREVYPNIGRSSTILPGVDAAAVASAQPDPSALPPLPAGAVVALTLARFVRGKGLENLIRGVAKAAASVPALHVVVCGGLEVEGYSATLEQLRDHLDAGDRVHLLGHVTEEAKRTLLATCDFVVHPATTEAFGLSVVEAMAAGKAVVAADSVGPRHIVTDGLTGLLYPRHDIDALAAAISRLCTEPALRSRLGRAGPGRAKEFTVEHMVGEVEGVLGEVLRGTVSGGGPAPLPPPGRGRTPA